MPFDEWYNSRLQQPEPGSLGGVTAALARRGLVGASTAPLTMRSPHSFKETKTCEP